MLMTIPRETSPGRRGKGRGLCDVENASYSRKLCPTSDNIFIVALNPSYACDDERQSIRRTSSVLPADDDDVNSSVVGLRQGGVLHRKVGSLSAGCDKLHLMDTN